MPPLPPFADILARAAERAGGAAALESRLPLAKDAAALGAVADDRYLSLMSRRVFRAGLRHSLVDGRWPAFEEVFLGFDPRRVVMMHDEMLEALMKERRIIRHWAKIRSVRDNAAAINAIAAEHGGFGAWLAAWPGARIMELWAELADRFVQMGGNSGPALLRMAGKDSFMLTGDVVRALVALGVVPKKPTTKPHRAAVQAAFNAWAAACARPLCQVSLVLALGGGR